jgi:hypothetical protein
MVFGREPYLFWNFQISAQAVTGRTGGGYLLTINVLLLSNQLIVCRDETDYKAP